ncbi:MAG TPA: hypothetical protein VKM72_06415 [Thermoanaerobaculia bacterium]|nr:hypothetical protein [Thermoanaerobaculia bacterium]
MSRQLSIERVLTELKARIEHHRSQEAFHAEQEVFHEKEKVRHAEELKMVEAHFETFQAAAEAVTGLVSPPQEREEEKEEKKIDDSIPPGKGAVLSRLVARVVAAKDPTEPFGASDITHEIQTRFGSRLKRKVDVRTVAAKLRRMAKSGLIHQTREGRSFHESMYSRLPEE